jgi:spermidine synthase
LAGFVLLRLYDMAIATYCAAAINAAVAGLALLLTTSTEYRAPADEGNTSTLERAPGAWNVYLSIGLSGLCALGAEVVWTRILSLQFGGTVYTFSIILAVFLAGLGIGSTFGSMLARAVISPRIALGVCQLLLVGGIAWTAFMTAR